MTIGNNMVLFGIAFLTFANTIFNWWSNRQVQQTTTATHALALKTELNTNSMKDALVKATALASEAKGRDDQRIIGEAKAAVLAEGSLAASQEPAKVGKDGPLPVKDDRTGHAAERSADALTKLATTTEKMEQKT